MASAVSRPLMATTRPVPSRASTQPLAKPDAADAEVMIIVTQPAAASDAPRSVRIGGQATPNTPSGRPRLMKAP